jgi:hypothetical protein
MSQLFNVMCLSKDGMRVEIKAMILYSLSVIFNGLRELLGQP